MPKFTVAIFQEQFVRDDRYYTVEAETAEDAVKKVEAAWEACEDSTGPDLIEIDGKCYPLPEPAEVISGDSGVYLPARKVEAAELCEPVDSVTAYYEGTVAPSVARSYRERNAGGRPPLNAHR